MSFLKENKGSYIPEQLSSLQKWMIQSSQIKLIKEEHVPELDNLIDEKLIRDINVWPAMSMIKYGRYFMQNDQQKYKQSVNQFNIRILNCLTGGAFFRALQKLQILIRDYGNEYKRKALSHKLNIKWKIEDLASKIGIKFPGGMRKQKDLVLDVVNQLVDNKDYENLREMRIMSPKCSVQKKIDFYSEKERITMYVCLRQQYETEIMKEIQQISQKIEFKDIYSLYYENYEHKKFKEFHIFHLPLQSYEGNAIQQQSQFIYKQIKDLDEKNQILKIIDEQRKTFYCNNFEHRRPLFEYFSDSASKDSDEDIITQSMVSRQHKIQDRITETLPHSINEIKQSVLPLEPQIIQPQDQIQAQIMPIIEKQNQQIIIQPPQELLHLKEIQNNQKQELESQEQSIIPNASKYEEIKQQKDDKEEIDMEELIQIQHLIFNYIQQNLDSEINSSQLSSYSNLNR